MRLHFCLGSVVRSQLNHPVLPFSFFFITRVNILANSGGGRSGRNKQISENEEEIKVFYCLALKNEEEIKEKGLRNCQGT